jgi:phenylacetic acid degradation operon negative regulatory protein
MQASSVSDRAVARWIRRTLAADPPRATSLIVTVWGDALAPHGGSVWLAGLIRLMAAFGINERLVRTSVFRLAADGWLARASRGRRSRYHLTADGARRFDDAYKRIYDRPADDWRGQWELVLADRVAAPQRPGLRQELAWAGFGELGTTTFLRPHEVGRALPSILAAKPIATSVTVAIGEDFAGRPIGSAVPEAWDLESLASGYRRFLGRFGAVIEHFREGNAHDPEQCFVVRTLLIHAYRRVLLRDPLLPPALLPLDWPGAAAYTLCRDFYRLTHRDAERHLASTLSEPGDPWPTGDEAFYRRFEGLPRG